jgi:hypothetical protein
MLGSASSLIIVSNMFSDIQIRRIVKLCIITPKCMALCHGHVLFDQERLHCLRPSEMEMRAASKSRHGNIDQSKIRPSLSFAILS